jgi:Rps23 Pro-64 3,4-dihydroxylase Tpa1-like proline 4-hydroxylase
VLNVPQIAQLYERAGRVHIAPILADEDAQRAYQSLVNDVPWQLHLNDGDRSYDLANEQVRSFPEATQVLLHERVNSNAVARFQYFFNNFPLSDAYTLGRNLDLYVMRVLEFLNSPEFLSFARQVTRDDRIAFADSQATLYLPGHFLTQHDNTVAGTNRIAAYVLSLTSQWRADWDGLLHFIDADGHVAECYTPAFNALNLFKVPQPHAVSYVAPFAGGGRFGISGWLHSK